MKIVDLHVHSKRSNHGKGDISEFIDKAINLNYSVIGFNEHAPYVFDYDNRLNLKGLDCYLTTLQRLKKEYQADIDILIGLEVDFHPDNNTFINNLLKDLPLDFCSGAIHFFNSQNRRLTVWDHDLFYRSEIIEKYFFLLEQAVKSNHFSFLAHPDIILRSGINVNMLIPQYIKLIKLMKKYNVAYEINCSGLSYNNFYYQFHKNIFHQMVL